MEVIINTDIEVVKRPRGRPRKTIPSEVREERLRQKCEKQKRWNAEHPEEYKERWMKTFLKNKEKINLRQKEKRHKNKIIKLKEKLEELNNIQLQLNKLTINGVQQELNQQLTY